MFLLTTLVSLPPGVMLLSRSTAPRDSTTNIEKTSQKGALEQERPNRSVVKRVKIFDFRFSLILIEKRLNFYMAFTAI